MKTSKLITIAAVSLLAAIGAQAETYQGVEPRVSANARADVRSEAVVAAHTEDPYSEAASSHVAPAPTASVARATVRNDAVLAAHSANPYAEGYGQGVISVPAGGVDRAAVRAQAYAASHGQQLPL